MDRNSRNAALIESDAVEQRGGNNIEARKIDIFAIFGEQKRRLRLEAVRAERQCAILLLRRKARQLARGRAGALTQLQRRIRRF